MFVCEISQFQWKLQTGYMLIKIIRRVSIKLQTQTRFQDKSVKSLHFLNAPLTVLTIPYKEGVTKLETSKDTGLALGIRSCAMWCSELCRLEIKSHRTSSWRVWAECSRGDCTPSCRSLRKPVDIYSRLVYGPDEGSVSGLRHVQQRPESGRSWISISYLILSGWVSN